jgi:uncharacterized protein YacL
MGGTAVHDVALAVIGIVVALVVAVFLAVVIVVLGASPVR